MAKRKRKMTLFDVINTGQPVGLQYRQRVPTHLPTPELPVKRKLAKLLGLKTAQQPDRPLTAAEELARLRQELSGEAEAAAEKPVEEVIEQAAPVRRGRTRYQPEPEPEATEPVFDPTEHYARPDSGRSRVAELAAAAEAAEQAEVTPRQPRKPLSQSAREVWAALEPKFAAMGARASHYSKTAWRHSEAAGRTGWTHLRELGVRYGVSAGVAAGVVVLLCGSFYAGRMLLNRPEVALHGTDLADASVRPDVIDIDAGVRANEPIANVSDAKTETKLERSGSKNDTTPVVPAAGPFGGRSLDLNYVIIQSYRTQAEAHATVEVLAKHGIKATVERDLRGYQGWFSVVSVDGFARMGGNEVYRRFLESINQVSDKEKGTTLTMRLDPRPYKHQAAE